MFSSSFFTGMKNVTESFAEHRRWQRSGRRIVIANEGEVEDGGGREDHEDSVDADRPPLADVRKPPRHEHHRREGDKGQQRSADRALRFAVERVHPRTNAAPIVVPSPQMHRTTRRGESQRTGRATPRDRRLGDRRASSSASIVSTVTGSAARSATPIDSTRVIGRSGWPLPADGGSCRVPRSRRRARTDQRQCAGCGRWRGPTPDGWARCEPRLCRRADERSRRGRR